MLFVVRRIAYGKSWARKVMSDFDSISALIPKPHRPQGADSQGINYSSVDPNSAGFHTKVNYLMEMMKFFPDYEREIYAGADQATITAAENQYAQAQNNVTPQFGAVVRSMSDGAVRANFEARNVGGLQFTDKAMADYEHLDEQTLGSRPITPGITTDLWQKVQSALKDEKGSYYDTMMQNSIASASPEKAFYVMVSMLESRSRIASGMSAIFGSPTLSGAERKATFDAWYQQNQDKYSAGEIGFLKFFLDIQQAFVAHANPLFGGSTEQVESPLDQTRAQQFTDTLRDKVALYLQAHPEQTSLWTAFINPASALPTAAQNTDPLSDSSMQSVYQKLNAEMDKVVQTSLGSKSIARSRQKKYKADMESYEDQVDEERQIQNDEEKNIRKSQAENKADLDKSAAQNRADRARLDQAQRVSAASKPVFVQKTKSAMANKFTVRTQPTAAAQPVAAVKSQQHKAAVSRPITAAPVPTVAGSSKRVATATKARTPLRNAAKPLSPRPKGILSATVSNVYKSRGTTAVKRQPKSKLSVS